VKTILDVFLGVTLAVPNTSGGKKNRLVCLCCKGLSVFFLRYVKKVCHSLDRCADELFWLIRWFLDAKAPVSPQGILRNLLCAVGWVILLLVVGDGCFHIAPRWQFCLLNIGRTFLFYAVCFVGGKDN